MTTSDANTNAISEAELAERLDDILLFLDCGLAFQARHLTEKWLLALRKNKPLDQAHWRRCQRGIGPRAFRPDDLETAEILNIRHG
jgi:hypothetical protein